MEKLAIGFVGTGGIARAHTKVLQQLENVRFAAFCDIIEEKAKSFASEYGGRTYTDFAEMYDKEELDAVFICLPPFAHTNEVQLAAEKGINIFIQKPIALDTDLAREMVKAVEKAGVKSQVGYQLRFGTGVQRARSMIESGELGHVTLATARYICRFLGGAWWRQLSKSGGQLVEQSTHAVDLLRYLCGDIERVYTELDKRFWTEVDDLEIEDVSASSIRFKSGAVGSMVATTGGYPGRWIVDLSIFTKEAVLDMPDPHSIRITHDGKSEREEFYKEVTDLQLTEAKHFTQAIVEDRETITPISEGAKTLAVTLEMIRSGFEKRPRTVPQ